MNDINDLDFTTTDGTPITRSHKEIVCSLVGHRWEWQATHLNDDTGALEDVKGDVLIDQTCEKFPCPVVVGRRPLLYRTEEGEACWLCSRCGHVEVMDDWKTPED